MINLLPPEQKKQIQAGMSNVLLLRYIILSLILAGLLFAMNGGVYLMLINSTKSAELAIQDGEQKSREYAQVQKDATAFRGNLATAKSILDKEVRYSEIAVKIAQTIPSGIVLQSLQLDASTFGQPVTLSARGKSHQDAIRLKTSLEDSPSFSNARLLSTSILEDGGAFPVSIEVSVVIDPGVTKND